MIEQVRGWVDRIEALVTDLVAKGATGYEGFRCFKGNLLGYKKFQVGDKIRILGGRLTSRIITDDVEVAFWDFKKGDTGTVKQVTRYGFVEKSPPRIMVEPDPEFGYGLFTFGARHVELVERPT